MKLDTIKRLGDVKIGDKFFHNGRLYIKIDMNPSTMFLSRSFSEFVCALDLTTYQVMCINAEYDVDVEYDNVYI